MEHKDHNYKAICAYIQAQITEGREGMSEGELCRVLGVDRLDARKMVQEWLKDAIATVPVPLEGGTI